VRRGALSALVLLAALAAPASTSAKDVTKLFDKAVAKVTSKPDFSDAVMLEADGTPKGNKPVDGAAQVTNWRFVFDNQGTRGSDFASVTIDWEKGEGFSKPDGNPSPFLEDLPIKRAPKMTLKRAIELLGDTGTHEFRNVTLRRPLGPEKTPPLYIFGVENNRFIAVNTKTGDVEPID
jgi:hypothetical protein